MHRSSSESVPRLASACRETTLLARTLARIAQSASRDATELTPLRRLCGASSAKASLGIISRDRARKGQRGGREGGDTKPVHFLALLLLTTPLPIIHKRSTTDADRRRPTPTDKPTNRRPAGLWPTLATFDQIAGGSGQLCGAMSAISGRDRPKINRSRAAGKPPATKGDAAAPKWPRGGTPSGRGAEGRVGRTGTPDMSVFFVPGKLFFMLGFQQDCYVSLSRV